MDDARLRTGLFLLLLEQRKKSHTRNLHNLESYTRNISLGVTRAAEPSNEHFVVLINEVQATIIGHEGGDLLAVLDQLNSHALAHSRVGLFRLNSTADQNGERGLLSESSKEPTELRLADLLIVAEGHIATTKKNRLKQRHHPSFFVQEKHTQGR